MKKCVYFPIIGDYDNLKEPTVITPGWDYICFTDNPELRSKHYEIRIVDNKEGYSNPRLARKIWILNHEYVGEYDVSISTGGQIYANCDLDAFVEEFLPADDNVDMAMHNRGIRDGVYHEGSICAAKGRDNPALIKQQMNFYRKEGLPDNTGIYSTGVIIRKHGRPNLERHCELWWGQVRDWSFRDQLSFNYVLWKHNLVNVSLFSRDVLRGPGNNFQKTKHKVR